MEEKTLCLFIFPPPRFHAFLFVTMLILRILASFTNVGNVFQALPRPPPTPSPRRLLPATAACPKPPRASRRFLAKGAQELRHNRHLWPPPRVIWRVDDFSPGPLVHRIYNFFIRSDRIVLLIFLPPESLAASLRPIQALKENEKD